MLEILLNEFEYSDIQAEFIFNPLEQLNELELAQANNLQADFYSKLIASGIISQDDALEMLKSKDLVNDNITIDNEIDNDFNLDLDNETNQD